ncbi:hypothetical protein pb186bvf_002143 [Paramecium bursaria]
MLQSSDQKMKTNDLCQIMDNQKDKHSFNKVIYSSYQLILLLLILLVYYGYHLKILARKHMLYLVLLFESYYDKCQLTDDLNNKIYIKIEQALQYESLENEDYDDDKYLDVFVYEKQLKDTIQQIINNSQFQFLLGKDSIQVCILEQLLKLSEVCSYKFDFIQIIQQMKKDFNLQDYEDAYINAYIELLFQNYTLCNIYIRKLIEKNQSYTKYFALQGRIFNLTGNHFKAIENLSAALDFYGKNEDNYYHFGKLISYIGIALYNNDQYEEALAAFEISQQLNGTIRNMLFLGSCYNKLKCDILALRWVDKALKLSPNNNKFYQIAPNLIIIKQWKQDKEFYTLIIFIQRGPMTFANYYKISLNHLIRLMDISMAFLISKYYPIEFSILNHKLYSSTRANGGGANRTRGLNIIDVDSLEFLEMNDCSL